MKPNNCSHDHDLYKKSKFYDKLSSVINYEYFYDLVVNPKLNKLHGCSYCLTIEDLNLTFEKIKKTKYLVIYSFDHNTAGSFNYCYEFCTKKHLKEYFEKMLIPSDACLLLTFNRSNYNKIEETIAKLELLR